jgi:hypothetical protein
VLLSKQELGSAGSFISANASAIEKVNIPFGDEVVATYLFGTHLWHLDEILDVALSLPVSDAIVAKVRVSAHQPLQKQEAQTVSS